MLFELLLVNGSYCKCMCTVCAPALESLNHHLLNTFVQCNRTKCFTSGRADEENDDTFPMLL